VRARGRRDDEVRARGDLGRVERARVDGELVDGAEEVAVGPAPTRRSSPSPRAIMTGYAPVLFLEDPGPEFLCALCADVMLNPVVLAACGHTVVCGGCADVLRGGPATTCETCDLPFREPFTDVSSLLPIAHLRMRCGLEGEPANGKRASPYRKEVRRARALCRAPRRPTVGPARKVLLDGAVQRI